MEAVLRADTTDVRAENKAKALERVEEKARGIRRS